jgi:hypothetical protein
MYSITQIFWFRLEIFFLAREIDANTSIISRCENIFFQNSFEDHVFEQPRKLWISHLLDI